jgi:endonuclease/exonuclease/phosphatase family metal-dependent hydrolase
VSGLPAGGTVVLMGDLNDVPGSPMYSVVRAAGLLDSWAELRHGAPGSTCCQQANLANVASQLDQRIDYVFVRAQGRAVAGFVERLGDVPADRIAGPVHQLWPSDHAGVALLMVP